MNRPNLRERDNVGRCGVDVERSVLAAAVVLAVGAVSLLAHKPITSKFNYNDHVFPIFRDRCSACHVDGGVAPMSLMTYVDAYPWAESIRAELVAGHMPPSQVDDALFPVRRPPPLTPRELDTILTWATGGTPEGPAAAKPGPIVLHNDWPLGAPDVIVDLPETVTLPAGEMHATRAFVVDDAAMRGRRLRAIDLLPGTPAIVRRATIRGRTTKATDAEILGRTLETWLPGGGAVAAPDGAYVEVGRDERLVVSVEYRKTWKYENQAVSDRSRIGFYFARPGAAREIATMRVAGAIATIDRDLEALAVRFDASQPDTDVVVRAIGPDGSQVPLIGGTTAPEWPRRFWFEHPVRLARGTRLQVDAGVGRAGEAEIWLMAGR